MTSCPPLLNSYELYGLGVRVGTYTQWLCTILTVCLMHNPRDRSGMRNVNYAFAFAEWVVMVNKNRTMWPADAVVVVFLFMGTVSLLSALEIFDRMRPRSARRTDPERGTTAEMARLLLLGGFIIWGVWWWFEGIDHTLQDCGTITFYYGGPVKIFGDFLLIGRIWSPLLLVMFIPVIEEFVIYIRDSYRRFKSLRHPLAEAKQLEARAQTAMAADPSTLEFWQQVFDSSQAAQETVPAGTDLPPETKQRRGLVCAIVLGIVMFVLISFLEVMLAYGDVDKINAIGGVGDTIPMVIGCGDMLLILNKLGRQRRKERARMRLAHQEGRPYRYPKTFLYDARFPLIERIRNLLGISRPENTEDTNPR